MHMADPSTANQSLLDQQGILAHWGHQDSHINGGPDARGVLRVAALDAGRLFNAASLLHGRVA